MKLTAMYTCLIGLLLFGMASHGYAQKGKKKEPTDAPTVAPVKQSNADGLRMYDAMFHNALRFGDIAVATNAVYGILSLKPDSTALMDTLAALYFQRAAWPQVVLVSTHILSMNPANEGALELRAIANQSLGRAKESLEDYEGLYRKTQNPYHLYEIATLQFAMKRFGECESSAQRLVTDQEVKEKTIGITMQTGEAQEVPLRAAALNLIGVINMEQGKKDTAKTAFEAALKVFPEFVLAKNNLDALEGLK